jgi:hypothetical protein
MVDERIVEYFKLHKSNYPLEDLKKKVLTAGYSQEDIQEALTKLHYESSRSAPTIQTKIKTIDEENVEDSNGIKKHDPANDKSLWLTTAGIAGILAFVFLIVSGFFADQEKINSFQLLFILLGFFSMTFFYYGFVVLGKRHEQKLLRVISWIFIIFAALIIIFQAVLIIIPSIINNIIKQIPPTVNYADMSSAIGVFFGVLIIPTIIFFVLLIVFIALNILFGTGLLKLKDKVKLSKLTGILIIIGSSTLIIGIGILILPVAYIFELILLFKASKGD